MSEILFEHPSGLTVSRYVGPELGFSIKEEPLTADRHRYQITNGAGMLVTLSAVEWNALCVFLGDGS
jgi:hypothetical protein